jgi:hypothetical protein
MSSCFARTRNARRRTRVVISTAVALAAGAALALPAGAAVNGSHVVAVLPATQGLELSGYPLNDTLNVHVIRNTVTIGSATGTTTSDKANLNSGDLNIAGGAAPCWIGSTPQILPGDEITVDDGGAGVDSMVVQNVAATSLERDPVTGDVLVHGFAIAPGGGEYDAVTFANSVQARITIAAGQHFANQRNNVRAGAGKFDGTISYDAPTANDPAPTTWTADFPLSDFDAQLALGSKDFEGVFTVGVSELTIGRQPPGASGCPAPAANSVTSFDRAAVNASNVGAPLTVSGVAQPDAANVSVVISDTKGDKVAFPDVAPSGGSFTTAAMDVGGLVDGTLTATPTFTVPGQPPFVGATLTIEKDVVAPAAPVASPPGGTYTATRAVTLGDDDPTAKVHYTTVGTAPGAASPTLATTPITVDHSLTIRAIAIDAAGNQSPEASFSYTITDPVTPPAGGGGGIAARPPASSPEPASAPAPAPAPATIAQQVPVILPPIVPAQAVQSATATSPPRPAVAGLRVGVRGRALRVSLRLAGGASVVRFRVLRLRHGRPSGRALATMLRLPSASGRYTVTLRGHALRSLKAGRYALVAQASASASLFGAAAVVPFTVR